MIQDTVDLIPKVLIYTDDSFGEDELTGVPNDNYEFGYYQVPRKLSSLMPKDSHEVDSSEFWISADEMMAYPKTVQGEQELMEDYGVKHSELRPMRYRYQ